MQNKETTPLKVLKYPQVSQIADQKVMADFKTGKYFLLKGSANDIWNLLKDGITIEEIIECLRKEYNVDKETCCKDVISFIDRMIQYGFLAYSIPS